MKEYMIESKNLNNSLVFYRALFDRMPEHLSEQLLIFSTSLFTLNIKASASDSKKVLEYRIAKKEELVAVHKRMNRFMGIQKFSNKCMKLDNSIGLIDPDGNRWKIGDPSSITDFNKCYFN